MSKLIKAPESRPDYAGPAGEEQERRQVLKRLGRFAAVSAPAVAVILAAETKPARAVITSGITAS
jgi:hypothetical protein